MPLNLGSKLAQIPRILAVLIAENDEYTYVDKLGYVSAPYLLINYLREALRDFSSLLAKDSWNNEYAREEAHKIELERVESEIDWLGSLSDPKDVREAASFISAKALARGISLKLKAGVEEGRR